MILDLWADSDVVRWLDVALAMTAVVIMTATAVERWPSMSRHDRQVVPWIIATYVVIAYGHGEIAAADLPVPPGFRLILNTVVLGGLIVALLYRRNAEPGYILDVEPLPRKVTPVTVSQQRLLTTDAQNRALRTFLVSLVADVGIAVTLLLYNIFDSANGWSEIDWAVMGFLLVKTLVTSAGSFVLRRFLDGSSLPTPLPPSPVAPPADPQP